MGTRISDDLLRKIKDAVNILEVVGEHVVLRKSGSNYTGLCPFHNERSPSFSVSEIKQLYHCYGCKKGGDLISFVMDLHGLSFFEATEELSDRAKIALPSELQNEIKKGNHSEKSEKLALAYKLNRFVAGYFHQNVNKDPALNQYFTGRGVHGELQKTFYVGGASSNWDGLTRFLIEKKAPLPLALELGLIRPSTKGSRDGVPYFDFFRNRALFPILDLRGRVSGFGGRLMPGADSESDSLSPKYLNSSESLLFQKSKILFGLFQAQKFIREHSQVIVVEGFFDALALHSGGFKNVVATCGTALTVEHLNLLKKFADQVICFFDSDSAGLQATQRAMELGLEQGQVIFGVSLPKSKENFKDPDEFLLDPITKQAIPERVELLKKEIANSQALIDKNMELQILAAKTSPEGQSRAVKQIAAWLAKFKDPIGREVRLQKAIKDLGLNRGIFEQAGVPVQSSSGSKLSPPLRFQSGQGPVRNPIKPTAHAPARPLKLTEREGVLLKALVQGERDVFDRYIKELPLNMTFSDLFDYSPVRDVTAPVFVDKASTDLFWKNPQSFLTSTQDPQVLSIVSEALMGGAEPLDPDSLRGAIGSSIRRVWARFSHQVKKRLDEAENLNDQPEHSRLMQEYLDVQRKIKEFSSFYDKSEG